MSEPSGPRSDYIKRLASMMKPDAWVCDVCGSGPVQFVTVPKNEMVDLRETPAGDVVPVVPMFCRRHAPKEKGLRRAMAEPGAQG